MKKVLIVEDDLLTARKLSCEIKEAGYAVTVAADSAQGVRFAHSDKPDLIVLDLMLPAGGGLWVLERLKMSANTRLIPVIVLTGLEDCEYKKKVLEFGIEHYFDKPHKIGELLAAVKREIGAGESGQ